MLFSVGTEKLVSIDEKKDGAKYRTNSVKAAKDLRLRWRFTFMQDSEAKCSGRPTVDGSTSKDIHGLRSSQTTDLKQTENPQQFPENNLPTWTEYELLLLRNGQDI